MNCSSREPETRRLTTKTATMARMKRIRMYGAMILPAIEPAIRFMIRL